MTCIYSCGQSLEVFALLIGYVTMLAVIGFTTEYIIERIKK